MSTRLAVDLLFLAVVGSVGGWIARAPADPQARAAYLCAPVALVAATAAHVEAAMADSGGIAPPDPSWRFDAARACTRIVAQVSRDLDS